VLALVRKEMSTLMQNSVSSAGRASPEASNTGPLQGVTVLDLTRLLPGNYCTWLLVMLGAEVIKVEDPGKGDYMRIFGRQVDGQGATHHLVNRGKRSIVIDLKSAAGRRLFLRFAARADVVVDSFRPGVMDRLGIGHDSLRGGKPDLVCASINGFGSVGDLASRAGHDLNFQALAGHASTPSEGSVSHRPGVVPWADLIGGGLIPALSIVASVLGARSSGIGSSVETSITEGIASLPHVLMGDLLAASSGHVAEREPGDIEDRAFYRVYRGADCFIAVAAIEEPFWRNVCTELGLEDLIPLQNSPEHQDLIMSRLESCLGSLTRHDVIERFHSADTCVTVVNSYEEFLDWDQTTSGGLLRDSPDIPMTVLGPPFLINGVRPPERGGAPRQGQDTVDLLRDLDLSEEEIKEALRAKTVVQYDLPG